MWLTKIVFPLSLYRVKNLYLALTWYLTAVCTLSFALLLLFYSSAPRQIPVSQSSRYQMYKALPLNPHLNQFEFSIEKKDGREIVVREFFESRKAPLAEHASDFVKTADKYEIDYRLLPAISMQESNGGKRLPNGSFNPFGYGIYGNKVLRFNSFAEAIDKVGKGLKDNYLSRGLTTPEEIMTKYTPPSLKIGGVWALGVATFMEQLL